MPDYVAQMWLTVQMALWGTFIAVLIAIPLGLAAARNISPVWIQQPVRRLLDVLRSLPELIIGLAFIVTVGLGPLTGVLALAINTGGVLGKLFSEAVETVAPGPIEGVRATGAAPLQEIVWGVVPQVAPLWTSYALYRFESNARSATVLGFIGAGRHRAAAVQRDAGVPVQPGRGDGHRHRGGGDAHRSPLAGDAQSAYLRLR